MNENIINNGYGYVDLGLPSKTLWATCNIGADKPSDFGLYFQWGDTVGYAKNQIGKVKKFNWANYKWSINGSSSNFTKYKTPGAILDLEDDAAHVNMGGTWHMPSPTQLKELTANTTNTWTTQDGVNGRLFISKKNGKSIFIPAAGYAWNGSLNDVGNEADVWSSTLNTDNIRDGQYLYFHSYYISLCNFYRYSGFTVRGVLG